jgi:hypothetical protein
LTANSLEVISKVKSLCKYKQELKLILHEFSSSPLIYKNHKYFGGEPAQKMMNISKLGTNARARLK